METLLEKISALETTLARVTSGRPIVGNPASEDSNPHHLPPKPTAACIQYFSHLPGENFAAWRAHFLEMVGLNRWNTAEAKSFAFGQMKGKAMEAVLDISTKVETESLDDFLNRYQKRFLPAARSQMLRAQFSYIKQLPGESVQSLHSRMRVLYHLAYPDKENRSEVFLVERFISALNNRDVQNFVRRRKPGTFEDALDVATEETSFVLLDIASHAPGGLQQPTPGDTSVIAALNSRTPSSLKNRGPERRCFYCDEVGHLKERCPARLKDFLKSRQGRPNSRPPPLKPPTTFPPKRGYGATPPAAPQRAGGSYSLASRRQAMMSAEAGAMFPYNSDRYGDARTKKQVAAVEECPAEAVAAVEAESDLLDEYDFSTLDDQTIAALYEEVILEDPLHEDHCEEDFPEGQ